MRGIMRWIYLHLPKYLRVKGNELSSLFRLKVLKQRGRTGADAVEVIGESHRMMMMETDLGIRVIRKDGSVEVHKSGPNTVTDAGVAFLVDDWDSGATEITNMNYHAFGTGGSPPSTPAVGVTGLVTEVDNRAAGVKSQPAANQIRTVGIVTALAPRTINEWGLFSASSSGTMWSSRWFTAIVLAAGDKIEFTYTLTLTSFTA